MNILQFMSDSPFLSFFLALIAAGVLEHVFYKLPKRYLRSRDIQKMGWPPKHLDADGDFKEIEET